MDFRLCDVHTQVTPKKPGTSTIDIDLIEAIHNNQRAGYLELTLAEGEMHAPPGTPFIQWIEVGKIYRRKKIGSLLIQEANRHALSQYQIPLHSGTGHHAEGKLLWNALRKQGVAEPYRYGNLRGWRIIHPQ